MNYNLSPQKHKCEELASFFATTLPFSHQKNRNLKLRQTLCRSQKLKFLFLLCLFVSFFTILNIILNY